MFSIRNGFFETNSSAVHAFVIPNDGRQIVPNVINFDNHYDDKFDPIFYIYNLLSDDDRLEFFRYLYNLGTERMRISDADKKHEIDEIMREERDPGARFYPKSSAIPPKNEEELRQFLFGEGTVFSDRQDGISDISIRTLLDTAKRNGFTESNSKIYFYRERFSGSYFNPDDCDDTEYIEQINMIKKLIKQCYQELLTVKNDSMIVRYEFDHNLSVRCASKKYQTDEQLLSVVDNIISKYKAKITSIVESIAKKYPDIRINTYSRNDNSVDEEDDVPRIKYDNQFCVSHLPYKLDLLNESESSNGK